MPRPLLLDDAPDDEFRLDILKALESRKWNEVTIRDWRMIGVSINVIRSYITDSALIYFLPSLMVGGINTDDVEYAIDALLPNNQRWEPGGDRWDAFVGALDDRQRKAIREFLSLVTHLEPEGSISRAGAEHALWNRFYG